MIKRKIITIDEDKCNGCGLCVTACHESAIAMIDGKAKLVSDIYCDGLGDCLPNCPTDAIKMIEREAVEYSQEAVDKRIEDLKSEEAVKPKISAFGFDMSAPKEKMDGHKHDHKHEHKHGGGGCNCNSGPKFEFKESENEKSVDGKINSELKQWPVQIDLINPDAPFLDDADILIAADCTAYAYGEFHREFVKGRVVMIGCPKFDDNLQYENKFEHIFEAHNIKSVTVVRMEVPCCSGITSSVRKALAKIEKEIPYNEVTVKVNGELAE